MLEALGAHVRRKDPDSDILGFLLPRMIAHFQNEFSCVADCGGGVGNAPLNYNAMLEHHLTPEVFSQSQIVTYEPLPENVVELRQRVGALSNVTIRPVAVGAINGSASFVVPSRMKGAAVWWGPGTSHGGFLGRSPNKESVTVEVVRLCDEPYDFDFLKFDLQGGEQDAIEGLGSKARNTKLMYVEQQLLGRPEAPDPMPLRVLHDAGFICAFDKVQFGFNPSISEIPVKLLREGGIEITRVRPADGRGIPFLIFGHFCFGGPTRLQADGSIDPEFVEAIKKAGIPWMATDIVAIKQEVYAETIALL